MCPVLCFTFVTNVFVSTSSVYLRQYCVCLYLYSASCLPSVCTVLIIVRTKFTFIGTVFIALSRQCTCWTAPNNSWRKSLINFYSVSPSEFLLMHCSDFNSFFWKMFIQSFCHVSALSYTTKSQQKDQTTALYCERAWARPSSSSTGATETNMSRLWNEPGPPLWEASTLAKIYLFRPAFSTYWFKASTCLCHYLFLRELLIFF